MNREYFKNLPDTSTPLSAERINGFLNGKESIDELMLGNITSKNLFNLYDEAELINITKVTLNGSSITVPSVDGLGGGVLFKTPILRYENTRLSFDTNGQTRFIIRCYREGGEKLDSLNISGWTYNNFYEGYYKDFNGVNKHFDEKLELPSEVATFQVMLAATGATASNIQIENIKNFTTSTIHEPYLAIPRLYVIEVNLKSQETYQNDILKNAKIVIASFQTITGDGSDWALQTIHLNDGYSLNTYSQYSCGSEYNSAAGTLFFRYTNLGPDCVLKRIAIFK